jgi:transcriptional regulator with XRE-family HTH domain
MAQPSTLGERVLLTRRRLGMTQKRLAELVGLNSHTIAQIERGRIQQLRSDAVVKLAKTLDVTTDYLLGMDMYDDASDDDAMILLEAVV